MGKERLEFNKIVFFEHLLLTFILMVKFTLDQVL